MTFHDKLGDAYAKLKTEYPALHNTALDYREGRNVFLTALSRDTKIEKSAVAAWLNTHTILKYDLRRRSNKK